MDVGFIRLGLFVFAILGVLHFLYTLLDLKTPKYFAPLDRNLLDRMQQTHVALAKNPKNFWQSYMGFNLSHSVGILVHVLTFAILSIIAPELVFHPAMMILLISTGFAYVILAQKFWFSIPLIGSLIGTIFFIVGAIIHY